jgi:hypothetical protein
MLLYRSAGWICIWIKSCVPCRLCYYLHASCTARYTSHILPESMFIFCSLPFHAMHYSLNAILFVFLTSLIYTGSWDSAVALVTGYRLDNWGIRKFSRHDVIQTDFGSIQPPIQLVLGLFSWSSNGQSSVVTTHFQLVPRLRKHGSIHPLLIVSSWCSV